MGKKHSNLMGLWDMKTIFHCSIVIFFFGGLATLSYNRNIIQEAAISTVRVTQPTIVITTPETTTIPIATENTTIPIATETTTIPVATETDTETINVKEKVDEEANEGTQVFDHQRRLKIAPPSITETCDLFSGQWVYDNKSHYPLYREDECKYLHGDLACQTYGRKDSKYQKWRWQPYGCDFPRSIAKKHFNHLCIFLLANNSPTHTYSRFDSKQMIEKLRNKRLLFVGDSVNRNQWDSMMCMLHTSIPGDKKLGQGLNKTLYTFRSNDYNISVDYYWAPMLVESNGDDPSNHRLDHRTIRVKSIEKHAKHWLDADFLVFNTYLWWRLPIIKFLKGPGSLLGGPAKDYDEVNNVRAYKMVLNTWSKWVHANIDPAKTKMFFMGLTATHSKATDWGGKNQGSCYKEKEPVTKEGFWESGTDLKMLRILESSLDKLKAKGTNVQLINITQLTQARKDAHPTVHRRLWRPLTDEQIQHPERSSDCTHWCLPGVPDIWNELLLAYIFRSTETASE